VPNLIVLTGPRRGSVLPLGPRATVGRGGADLRLPDELMSGEHAEITAAGGGFWIRDLGSTNGTFVNGARVTGEAALIEGDVVHLGVTELLFTDQSELDAALSPGEAFRVLGRTAPEQTFDVRLLADSDEELVLGSPKRGVGLTQVLPHMHAVENTFSAAADLDDLLERVAAYYARAVDGSAVVVLLAGHRGPPEPILWGAPQGARLARTAPEAFPIRRPLIEGATRTGGAYLGRDEGGRLSFAVGLPAAGRVIGAVYVHDTREALTQQDLRPLLLVAKLAGVHAWAHVLVAELRQRNAELEDANLALEGARSRLASWNEELQAAVEARTAALGASEARYRSLFHESRDGNFTVDRAGRLQELNGVAVSLVPPEAQEPGGPSLWAVLGEPFASRLGGDAAIEPVPDLVEVRLRGRDGLVRRVEVSARPIFDDAALVGYHGILRDVTARHEAAARTRLLSRIVENVPEAVVTTDLDGVVTSWNPGAEALYGLSAAEVIGAVLPTVPDELGEELERAFVAARDGKPLVLRSRRLDRDGRPFPALVTFAPVSDGEGATVGLVELAHDLTEQEAQERRTRAREQLASFGELAAGLAHELGNPLSNLRSGVEYLLDRPREPEVARESLELLQHELERLQRLVQQTLDLARWRVPSFSAVAANEVLRYVAAVVRDRAAELGIDLVVTPAPGELEVQGHMDQLKQALLNLVSNAFSAMPQGGMLELSAAAVGRQSVELRVRDTGRGVPPELQERVFDLFFSDRHGGSGIGLAVVKRIVDLHEGEVLLESEPGLGTTVALVLPRADRSQA